jgi:hypothetical protein
MPPKRATARKRRKQEDEGGEGESKVVALAQTPKPSRRGRTGKLAGLTQMPLDILYEVCWSLYVRNWTDLTVHRSFAT